MQMCNLECELEVRSSEALALSAEMPVCSSPQTEVWVQNTEGIGSSIHKGQMPTVNTDRICIKRITKLHLIKTPCRCPLPPMMRDCAGGCAQSCGLRVL